MSEKCRKRNSNFDNPLTFRRTDGGKNMGSKIWARRNNKIYSLPNRLNTLSWQMMPYK